MPGAGLLAKHDRPLAGLEPAALLTGCAKPTALLTGCGVYKVHQAPLCGGFVSRILKQARHERQICGERGWHLPQELSYSQASPSASMAEHSAAVALSLSLPLPPSPSPPQSETSESTTAVGNEFSQPVIDNAKGCLV